MWSPRLPSRSHGCGSAPHTAAARPGRREARWVPVVSLLRPPFSHQRSRSFYHKDPQAAPPSGALPPPPPASSLSCSKQTAFKQQRLAHRLEGQHRPPAPGRPLPRFVLLCPPSTLPPSPFPFRPSSSGSAPFLRGMRQQEVHVHCHYPARQRPPTPTPARAPQRRAGRTPAGFD